MQIVGVVRGVTHNGVTEIGPIAVHPDHQGKGVGRQLMTTVESRAKGGKCTVGIVSCRTDVIPFFEHMGFTVHIQKFKALKNIQSIQLACVQDVLLASNTFFSENDIKIH